MAKRSYVTHSEALEFAQWTHSESRRFKLQKELEEKIKQGFQNPTPLVIAVRQVTKKDYLEWQKNKEL